MLTLAPTALFFTTLIALFIVGEVLTNRRA